MLPLLVLHLGEATSARGEVVDCFSDGKLGSWTLVGNCWPASRATPAISNIGSQFNGSAGKYFLLSYNRSNQDTGAALSKEFTITRPFINFKVVGGEDPKGEALGVRLIVDEKPVRITTGNNSLTFGRRCWDVGEFVGKSARIQVVDQSRAEQFGFIGVDAFRQDELPDTKEQDYFESEIRKVAPTLPGSCFGGGISIDGKVVACFATGTRRVGGSEKMTIHDRVMIGSISKPVCGYIVAKVVESGALKWTTTFQEVCPDLVGASASSAKGASVEQFACMVSGLGPDLGYDKRSTRRVPGPVARREANRLGMQQPASALPGEKYAYGGSDTAVYMAERVTGQSLEDLIQKYICEPAHAPSIRLGLPEGGKPGVTYPIGSILDEQNKFIEYGNQYVSEEDRYKKSMDPGGAITGSVIDLLRALTLCAGFTADSKPALVKDIWTDPFSISHFTRSSFIKWSGGLFCAGSYGAEYANVQVLKEPKAVIFYYTNFTRRISGTDIGALIARVNDTIGSRRLTEVGSK